MPQRESQLCILTDEGDVLGRRIRTTTRALSREDPAVTTNTNPPSVTAGASAAPARS
ncbi:MAG TPA: hypothetical protein VFU40_06340 [Gemmatimonadales bacterium]|nr:hypothetical protein [Gemmatimonadales bacterium]